MNKSFDKDPICYHSGMCESDATNEEVDFGYCIHCGGDMFKEGGIWWHHTQEEIPIEERGTNHFGI